MQINVFVIRPKALSHIPISQPLSLRVSYLIGVVAGLGAPRHVRGSIMPYPFTFGGREVELEKRRGQERCQNNVGISIRAMSITHCTHTSFKLKVVTSSHDSNSKY